LVHPLLMIHQHRIRHERLAELAAVARSESVERSSRALACRRTASLRCRLQRDPASNDRSAWAGATVASAVGLREGLLYRDLDEETRAQDPLLAAALEVGERLGRFGDHGAALDQWIDPLFPHESSDHQRLRLAACLLGDIAWNAHPDYRAERAVDMAVHGNWVGIDAHDRAMLGRALCSALAAMAGSASSFASLLRPGEDERAIAGARRSAWRSG
jgi:exopolyphosphatase/guanosine-5'-triphosphate,3'-diphosphate pyrophosphatase